MKQLNALSARERFDGPVAAPDDARIFAAAGLERRLRRRDVQAASLKVFDRALRVDMPRHTAVREKFTKTMNDRPSCAEPGV